eukprot:Tbor_TRINITY_DN4438_c0_g1::TRINITY_DN4438_c0_g1_i1::g.8018::m.8018
MDDIQKIDVNQQQQQHVASSNFEETTPQVVGEEPPSATLIPNTEDKQQQDTNNTTPISMEPEKTKHTKPETHTRLTAGNLRKLANELSQGSDECVFEDCMQYVMRPHNSWDSAVKELARLETLRELNCGKSNASQTSVSAYSIANTSMTARSSIAARKGHLGMLPLGGQTSNTINPPRTDTGLILTGVHATGVGIIRGESVSNRGRKERGASSVRSVVSCSESQEASTYMTHVSPSNSECGLIEKAVSINETYKRKGVSGNHPSTPQPISKFQFQQLKNGGVKEVDNDSIRQDGGGRSTTAVGPPSGLSGHVRINSFRSGVFAAQSSGNPNEKNCSKQTVKHKQSTLVSGAGDTIGGNSMRDRSKRQPSSSCGNSNTSSTTKRYHCSPMLRKGSINNNQKQQQSSCTFGIRHYIPGKGEKGNDNNKALPPLDLNDGLMIIGGIARS